MSLASNVREQLSPSCGSRYGIYVCDEQLHRIAKAALIFAESLELPVVIERIAQQGAALFGGICHVHFTPQHRPADARRVVGVAQSATLWADMASYDGRIVPAQDEIDLGELETAPSAVLLVAPLIARGKRIGALEIVLQAPDDTAIAHNQHLLHTLAAHAGLAIDTADQVAQLRPAPSTSEAEITADDAGSFLALVAHDLRNPLTTLSFCIQLLTRHTRSAQKLDRGKLARMAELADAAILQIERQIDELTVSAPADPQRHQVLEQRIDLVRLVQLMHSSFQQTTDRHQLTIQMDVPELLGPWSQPHLERVIGNLLANGIKYSPAGGEIRIRVSQEQDESGDWAMLSVKNQGIGIPVHDLPRLAQSRYRAGNVGTIPGTGLGLVSVREVVERYGGTLAIQSAVDGTTIFCVRLPLA